MPILKHAKYEIFAQEVAKGTSLEDAHVIAGYKRNASNASTLSRKPEIAGRITELKQLGATSAIKAIGVTKERIVKIGFSNMLDYVRISADGLPYCDFSAITRDQAAAIQEVNVEVGSAIEYNEKGERTAVPVRKVRFKLADKRAALIDMGKHLGMFKEDQIVPRVRTDKSIAELRDELLQDMVEAGLVTLLPAEPEVSAGVANQKTDGTKH
jgi:phage terminase small subunit